MPLQIPQQRLKRAEMEMLVVTVTDTTAAGEEITSDVSSRGPGGGFGIGDNMRSFYLNGQELIDGNLDLHSN